MKPAAWWRVPLLWVLLGLTAVVLAASVFTVWIARHAADTELPAPPPVMHIGPPGHAGAAHAASPSPSPAGRDNAGG
ncbi:MAG: hypothetical protein KGJ64_02920 [Betaproteobacteria bacterium]|nr:hypothetical protein [Betaproteobacteria bacterium]